MKKNRYDTLAEVRQILAQEEDEMTVKITPNDKGNPPGKLADAELHFAKSRSKGKLIGFSVWEPRGGNGRNVTFAARQSSQHER